MFNPHPPLTGFPFVLLVLLAGVEFFRVGLRRPGLDRTAELLLVVLAIAAPLTFLTGYLAASQADQSFKIDPEVIERHRAIGRLLIISLVPMVLAAYLRRAAMLRTGRHSAVLNSIYLSLLFVSLALAILTGYRGGGLVFEYGAGVRAPITNPAGTDAPIR